MEWNRRNIIAAIVILVLGFGSGAVIYCDQEGGLSFAIFRLKRWVNSHSGSASPALSASEIARAKKKSDEVIKKELARYPELQIKPKLVAEAQNGFLAVIKIKDDPRLLDLQRSKITTKVDGVIINADDVKRDLEPYEEIGAEIERIASLPERSSENLPIPFEWFFPSLEFKTMADYLMLKARLASMRKDEGEAFRYVELIVNLSEHLNEIERPSFLSETVCVLVRKGVRRSLMSYILPALGSEVDFEKWRSLLKPRLAVGDRLSSLIITELNFFHQDFSHLIFTGADAVPDPEAFCKAYVAYRDGVVKQYRGVDCSKLLSVKLPTFASFDKNLSRESLRLRSVIYSGEFSWVRGYVYNSVAEAQFAAALDLLIREKVGEDLSKLSETYVMNPHTGKPFAYDAATRTLDKVTVGTSGDIEALKLPW